MRQPGKAKGKNKRTIWIVIVFIAGLAAAAIFFVPQYFGETKRTNADAEVQRTAIAEVRDMTSELSSSGTIAPKDTYSITSLVEGDVISAAFEEGDQVAAGQILYQIDVSSLETELHSAASSLERAQSSYQRAVNDYNEAAAKYSGNTYKATERGYIKTLYIKEGDKVSSNSKLADIYSEQRMKLKVPFLSAEAGLLAVGQGAVVTLTETQEQIAGIITAISSMEETLVGGRIVRDVTVEVENPGGLTNSHIAVVTAADFACSMEASFEPTVNYEMKADLDSSIEIGSLLVQEGDFIEKGTPVFSIESSSAEKLIRSFKDSMDKAEESLESAQNKVDSTNEDYGDYTITAPISGQVITKSVKAGDTISRGSGGSVTMAVIYDLSSVTFEMSVDELDVGSVKVGQQVSITADAIEEEEFSGIVTNVSLESAASNGVTNYPVTVALDKVGDLLPGMNVDGRIILDQADEALTIPADALMRGNLVYVKDETVTEAQGRIPSGFRAAEVETGLINDDYVQILSGISIGDEVYVSESTVATNQTFLAPAGGGMPGGGGGGMPGGMPGGTSGGGQSRSGSGMN